LLQKLLYNFDIAVEAIKRNKLRGFLTSLGIIFGVASVIAMLAIGTGAQQEVLEQMALLGTNNVIIQPVISQMEGDVGDDEEQKSKRYSPGLTLEDLESIREIIPAVEKISPEIIFETTFIRSARLRTGKLIGVNTDYFDINQFEIIEGTSFTDVHFDESMPVCVIGYDVKAKFFAGEEAIGKKIKVGRLWLTVIGVLEKKELSTESIEMYIRE
jgi:putative ABC transport system permease protein